MTDLSNIPSEALDLLQTNVFYANKNLELLFINKKGMSTLNSISAEIKQTLNVGVDELIGINLDRLHGHRKQEIRDILGNPRNFPYNSEIKIADLVLDLNVNVVFDSMGDIEGYVVNWEEISDKKRFELEAGRSKQMVDKSPINTLMATIDGKMIYMNDSSRNTLKKLEQYLPDKVENLVGKSIDIFHKNPDVQRKIISNPSNLPHKATIQLGPEKLDLLISAVTDHQGNYLGPMVNWEVITDKVQLVADLGDNADSLAKSADELIQVASSLTSAAEETSAQASTASAASEEVNAGVQSVKTNMNQMVSAIQEITKTTNEASTVSNEALQMAKNTNQVIDQLGESSMDIGNVIKVISSIAQQTNLLALNATIEAARAGEAGKGFAVVANEVKELAKQTAKATQEITQKIENIQNDSKGAVNAIAEISAAIEKINGMASNIAAAVEEQSATTQEVTRVVGESAQGVTQISQNIQQVSEAAQITGKDANSAQQSSVQLKSVADTLRSYVKRLEADMTS